MEANLEDEILLHARKHKLELDQDFVTAIISSAKNIGSLNPKIPDAFVKAQLKNVSPKLSGKRMPGISALSVPIAQKFDCAGGPAIFFRAFRFLLTPFDVGGKRITIIDDMLSNGPASAVMREILGRGWDDCIRVVADRISQPAGHWVDPGEKQIFWQTRPGQYLLISPLADTLPAELAHRLSERSKAGQLFRELGWHVGGDKFQNAGVMATELGGELPKLMALPPEAPRPPTIYPDATPGRFLVLEFDATRFNATGASISGGVATIPAVLGFSEALRRKLGDRGLQISPASIALGLSAVQFHGTYDRGWNYSVQKGSRDSAKGMVPYPVPELTANARVHVAVRLDEALDPAQLREMTEILVSLRFAGGSIFNPDWTVSDDLSSVFDLWGSDVWMVADRQYEIEDAPDRLDAALDRLAIEQAKGGAWEAAVRVTRWRQ